MFTWQFTQPRSMPDPVESLPVACRIEGAFGVRTILRDLEERSVSISLYPERNVGAFLLCRIVELDEEEVGFDLSGQDQLLDMLAPANAVIGVAFPDGIKIQFCLARFSVQMVDPPGYPVLRASLPAELYRIQRREAFRVSPPEGDQIQCVRRVSPENEARYTVADLSASGVTILLPPKAPVPEIGERWLRSRIETATGLAIPCELLVRHVTEDRSGSGAHRIGMAFCALPRQVQRQIEVYVLSRAKGSQGTDRN